eukprot:PhF_6_TR8797/c0_g1_i1/m.13967/K00461/ALOX5; arachidonate 5-lipoxygenase
MAVSMLGSLLWGRCCGVRGDHNTLSTPNEKHNIPPNKSKQVLQQFVPDCTVLPQKDKDPEQRHREVRTCSTLYAPSVKHHADLPAVSHCVPRIDQSKVFRVPKAIPRDIPPPPERFDSLMAIDLYFAQCDMQITRASQLWTQDTELSRQVLRGVDLCLLTRENYPSVVSVLMENEDVLAGLLDRHDTLEDALKASTLFCVSYDEMSEQRRRSCCSKCLEYMSRNLILDRVFGVFYLSRTNQLIPMCIYHRDVMYTPNDNRYAWIYAKTVLKHCMLIRNVIIRPVGIRLGFGSVVASLVYSCFSVRHPIRQMLTPYLLNTLSTYHGVCDENFNFLSQFFPNDCGTDHVPLVMELAAEEFSSFEFVTALNFVKDVRSRGMDDPAVKNVQYTYADDALFLWNAVERYVRAVITMYYKTPSDITHDTEITSFFRALRVVCPSVPPIREYTVEPLVTTLMGLVWLFTCLPSVWRGEVDDVLKYPPNMPLTMRSIHVTQDGADYVTETDLLNAFPNPTSMMRQVIFTKILQSAHEGAYKLTSHVRVFADDAAQALYVTFLKDLETAGKMASLRKSENRDEVHKALIPDNISIAMPLL